MFIYMINENPVNKKGKNAYVLFIFLVLFR